MSINPLVLELARDVAELERRLASAKALLSVAVQELYPELDHGPEGVTLRSVWAMANSNQTSPEAVSPTST